MTDTATQWRAAWQMPGGFPQATSDTWAYVLDDAGDVRWGQGWWPFDAPAAWFTTPQPTGIRLSPDIAHYAWSTEYVIVWPETEGFATAWCYIVPRAEGAELDRVTFGLRLHEETGWEAQLPEKCADLEVLAEKASRVCAFLNTATAARDSGGPLRTLFNGIRQPVKEDPDASTN